MKTAPIETQQRKLHYIPVSAIDEASDVFSVRQFFDVEKLTELSESIGEKGVLQPILVRPKKDMPDRYEVVMGMRRFKSAILSGYQEMPCVIEDVDDKEALEMALTENIQREDLTPLEEAWGLMKLIRDFNYTETMVCARLKKSFAYVNSRLKLLALPESVQKIVFQGKLGLNQAATLINLHTAKEQEEVAREIIKRSLTTEQVKDIVEAKTSRPKKPFGAYAHQKRLWRDIDTQVNKLTDSLKELNVQQTAFTDRENIKVVLLNFKAVIDKVIEEIDGAD
jgi:ParB family transcriptional regulator, chromosome partitioning protein